jgi:hypothetical protein
MIINAQSRGKLEPCQTGKDKTNDLEIFLAQFLDLFSVLVLNTLQIVSGRGGTFFSSLERYYHNAMGRE